MKRLTDYTNEELRDLNQDGIERLIDLECCFEGIPLLPESSPVKPEVNKPQEDLNLFNIDDVLLERKEDAQEIVNLLNGMTRMRRDWSTDGYVLNEESVSFKPQKAFSSEHREKHKAQEKAAKEIETRYNLAKKEYDGIIKERKSVIDKVSVAVGLAFDEVEKINRYKKQYARYLQLAEGEKDIALNFMKAAHPDEDEYIEEILGKISDDIMLGTQANPDDRAPLPA